MCVVSEYYLFFLRSSSLLQLWSSSCSSGIPKQISWRSPYTVYEGFFVFTSLVHTLTDKHQTVIYQLVWYRYHHVIVVVVNSRFDSEAHLKCRRVYTRNASNRVRKCSTASPYHPSVFGAVARSRYSVNHTAIVFKVVQCIVRCSTVYTLMLSP